MKESKRQAIIEIALEQYYAKVFDQVLRARDHKIVESFEVLNDYAAQVLEVWGEEEDKLKKLLGGE